MRWERQVLITEEEVVTKFEEVSRIGAYLYLSLLVDWLLTLPAAKACRRYETELLPEVRVQYVCTEKEHWKKIQSRRAFLDHRGPGGRDGSKQGASMPIGPHDECQRKRRGLARRQIVNSRT